MATVRLTVIVDRDPSTGWWRVFAADSEVGHKYYAGHRSSLATALRQLNTLVTTQYPDDPDLIVLSTGVLDT